MLRPVRLELTSEAYETPKETISSTAQYIIVKELSHGGMAEHHIRLHFNHLHTPLHFHRGSRLGYYHKYCPILTVGTAPSAFIPLSRVVAGAAVLPIGKYYSDAFTYSATLNP